MQPETIPAVLAFDAKVTLTILNGHLAAAGTLLCDPIAKVSEHTKRTFANQRSAHHPATASAADGGGRSDKSITTLLSQRPIRSTKQRIFTAHPNFDEVLSFVVRALDAEDGTVGRAAAVASGAAATNGNGNDAHATSSLVATERNLLIDIEDSTGTFFGQAQCPFALDRPSKGAQRLMLLPRFVGQQQDDHPTFIEDVKTLDRYGIDDFGFLNIEWEVTLLPHGGALLPTNAHPAGKPLPPPPLPVGLVIKANWVPSTVAGSSMIDASTGARSRGSANSNVSFHTFVELGTDGSTAFRLENRVPLFVGLSRVDLLDQATFVCKSQTGQHGNTLTCRVVFPIPPFLPNVMDRDIMYCAPLFADGVEDQQGLLLVSLRALSKPIEGPLAACRDGARCSKVNDPCHQAQASHPAAADWGRPMPDTPAGAYQPIVWESEAHIARATERRWKLDCVRHARPTQEHVRHVFEALLGRTALDLNVAQVASSFFNKAANTMTNADLQQLLLGVIFHAEGMSLREAARFAFVVMRRDAERAITVEDVVFILEHSLFGRTVDMPRSEIERRVTDILGPLATNQQGAKATTSTAPTPSQTASSSAATAAPPAAAATAAAAGGTTPSTGSATQNQNYVSFDEYCTFFVNHAALWFDLGAPLMFPVNTSSGYWEQVTPTLGQHHQQQAVVSAAANLSSSGGGGQGSAQNASQPTANNNTHGARSPVAPGAQQQQQQQHDVPENWRTFTVRVIKTGRPFSVTAHVNDTVQDVMGMVEESATIPVGRQKWVFHGLAIDPRRKIGDVFGAAPPGNGKASHRNGSSVEQREPEVSIQEKEEVLRLVVVHREKNKKWEQEFLATEKVLRLRAFVQHKTMIPLSRCAMTSCGVTMQDRHTLDYYKLVDGSIIEVVQQ